MKDRFSKLFLGFTHFWDYKPTIAIQSDSPRVYTSDKVLNSITKYKIHLKCDVTNGSVLLGVRPHFLYSFFK